MKKVRIEVHTRSRFAQLEAEKCFVNMGFAHKSGNVLTCVHTVRFLRCKRIYDHYNNEFADAQELPKREYTFN